jgi:hypothetical protein
MLWEWRSYKCLLNSFCLDIGMDISFNKLLILGNEFSKEMEEQICILFTLGTSL